MTHKYHKFIWKTKDTEDGFAIVKNSKPVDEDSRFYTSKSLEKNEYEGVLVYGSRVKYEKSGSSYVFGSMDEIIELDPQYVLDNYFEGLF